MSLASGKKIHGRTWDEIPISDDVIARVHAIAEEVDQPLITNNFVFEWKLDGEEVLGYKEGNDEEETEELLRNDNRETPIMLNNDGESETSSDTDKDGDSSDDEDFGGIPDIICKVCTIPGICMSRCVCLGNFSYEYRKNIGKLPLL